MLVKELVFDNLKNPWLLFGENDNYLKYVESELGVSIFAKGNEITIQGIDDNVQQAERILTFMFYETQKGKSLNTGDLKFLLDQVKQKQDVNQDVIKKNGIHVAKSGKIVKARTAHQFEYIDAIRNFDAVFGIGPAGTGKTYLAVAMGLNAILKGEKKRLILTRPVVEAGESLGFLPGDFQQKINPYLRPLFDAIIDMIPFEEASRYKDKEIIEIAPLAYMRGRTLNDAFIILDEAQNTTIAQLKMFLSRLGDTSKVVVTGDLTQIDLPRNVKSGLVFANKALSHLEQIKFIFFTGKDIIRHPLVKIILEAFDQFEKE